MPAKNDKIYVGYWYTNKDTNNINDEPQYAVR